MSSSTCRQTLTCGITVLTFQWEITFRNLSPVKGQSGQQPTAKLVIMYYGGGEQSVSCMYSAFSSDSVPAGEVPIK